MDASVVSITISGSAGRRVGAGVIGILQGKVAGVTGAAVDDQRSSGHGMSKVKACIGASIMTACALSAFAQLAPAVPGRDEFFWLGEINKASAVINSEEGLLDRSMIPR